MAYPDKVTYFLTNGGRRMDGRLWMHYNAVCVTPAMALTRPGAGSDYGIAGLDSEHRPLDGAKTYKLHLPPTVPMKDNWSVTIYDTQTCAYQIIHPMQMPHCEGSVPDQKLVGLRKGRLRPVNQPVECGHLEVALQYLWNSLIHRRLSVPLGKEE